MADKAVGRLMTGVGGENGLFVEGAAS